MDLLQDQSKRFQFVREPKAVATSGEASLVTSQVSSRGECLNMQEEKKVITFHTEATESSGMMRYGSAMLTRDQQSSGSACTCGAVSWACAEHRRSSLCLPSLPLWLAACLGVAWLYSLCTCHFIVRGMKGRVAPLKIHLFSDSGKVLRWRVLRLQRKGVRIPC